MKNDILNLQVMHQNLKAGGQTGITRIGFPEAEVVKGTRGEEHRLKLYLTKSVQGKLS